MRRMPVRYIKQKHTLTCAVCGGPPSLENPLQHSHIIGFNIGVRKFALTPDFLDSSNNIKSAHRKICNRALEKPEALVKAYLEDIGLDLPSWLLVE